MINSANSIQACFPPIHAHRKSSRALFLTRSLFWSNIERIIIVRKFKAKTEIVNKNLF